MIEDTQSSLKGYYLYYEDIFDGAVTGPDRKVAAQIKAFNNAGLDCDFLFCKQPKTVGTKILSCLPYLSDGVDWPSPTSLSDCSFLYIRRSRFFSKDFIRFIKETKEAKPDIKIILEIPTFPYDDEMRAPLLFPAYLKDRKYRKQLRNNIDIIACPSTETEIFGVEAIHVYNGIDLSSIVPKKPALNLLEVNIIATAYFMRWHGLDRLIEGMSNYYRGAGSSRSIILHVAGSGAEIQPLKRKVQSDGLENKVVFHGYCDSDKLDTLFDQCSFAVECLGIHRKGLTLSSSLKSREYLAKGIPFIYANDIDVLVDDPADFCLRIHADDTSVNIEALLSFHDKLYSSETQENLINRIRLYAETHVGIDVTMKKIIEYIRFQ